MQHMRAKHIECATTRTPVGLPGIRALFVCETLNIPDDGGMAQIADRSFLKKRIRILPAEKLRKLEINHMCDFCFLGCIQQGTRLFQRDSDRLLEKEVLAI